MTKLFILIALATLLAATLEVAAKPSGTRAERKAAEKTFLSENALRLGVVTTKSGLQYEILKSGNGKEHPRYRQKISIHYHGTFTDGSVFQSTYQLESPIEIKFENVIAGWKEGLKLMRIGDKFRFYIPSKLGYGAFQKDEIPGYSVLIFDIELFGIE